MHGLVADLPERASGELGYHILDIVVANTDATASGDWVAVARTVASSSPVPEGWNPMAVTL